MKTKFKILIAVITALLGTVQISTAQWCEDFENYSPGSSISPVWYLSGNNSAHIDNSIYYGGQQSARLYGVEGGCWATLAAKHVDYEFPFELEMYIRNGSESLNGCHQYRATLSFKNGPHWTNKTLVHPIYFLENGDLLIQFGVNDTISGFGLNEWHKVNIKLDLLGDGYLYADFEVNNVWLGRYSMAEQDWMNNMSNQYLMIGAQEGTAWFDDICITPRLTQKVFVDIKPASCPNPLNVRPYTSEIVFENENIPSNSTAKDVPDDYRRPKAVLPVAILGADDFSVLSIDPLTVTLAGVSPLRYNYEDVATPVGDDAEQCECNSLGPDGYQDLTLKFDKAAIINAIGEVNDGDVIVLSLEGELYDGTLIEGEDCVIILNGKNTEAEFLDDDPANSIAYSNIPQEFALEQNHPNPFNPITGISFSLPVASDVTLNVFDILGRRVEVLVDDYLEAGMHSVTFDASNLASGIYFYRIEAGKFTETRKMTLLK